MTKTYDELDPIKQHDTLKPMSYYPVFPGSYWVYLNEKSDIVEHKISETYIKDCYAPGYTDAVLVPFLYDSRDRFSYGKPIYQYDVISKFLPYVTGGQNYYRTRFLSEK